MIKHNPLHEYLSLRCLCIAGATLAVSAPSGGCSSPESQVQLNVDSIDKEQEWKTFLSSQPRLSDGQYLVEGDMRFHSAESLRRYWDEEHAAASAGALTVSTFLRDGVAVDNIWSPETKMALEYCMGTGFTEEQSKTLATALVAAEDAWAGTTSVRFTQKAVQGTCDATNADVVFDVQRNTSGAFFGSAFFPNESRDKRTLLVDDSAFTTTAGGRTLTGINFRRASGYRARSRLRHALSALPEAIWGWL